MENKEEGKIKEAEKKNDEQPSTQVKKQTFESMKKNKGKRKKK